MPHRSEKDMSSPNKKRILIVDDEPEIREILSEDLKAKGYEVLESSSGNDAILIYDSNPDIDIIISDIVMADGDGLQLLDHVKSNNLEKPAVILISAYADDTLEETYDRGAEAFFPKPFDRQALFETVDRILDPDVDKWRRKSSRLGIDQKLALSISVPDFTAAATRASIINVGRGGMFLAWGDDLPDPGEIVEFEISFLAPNALDFKGKGIVRWVRFERDESNALPGIGIEFYDLDKEHYSTLVDVLNFIQTKAFIPKS